MLGKHEPFDSAQCHPGVTAPACRLPGHCSHGPSPAWALQSPQPLVAPTWARVQGWTPHTGTPVPSMSRPEQKGGRQRLRMEI